VVLRDAIFHAAFAWALLAPFCVYLLHRLFTPLFERMAAQMRRPPLN
jgi:thiosulfate reductase cytochrome b subunit